MKTLLNVGGASKQIPVPAYYAGWEHHLLDIDARCNPDVLMDARELDKLPAGTYDAVYCLHNLEHYNRRDGRKVLSGFAHVLKDGGFAEVRVPDVQAVMHHAVQNAMDLDDVLYNSPAGPVLVRDIFYGHHIQVEQAGNEFYAHKTGFSRKSLMNFIGGTGFHSQAVGSHNLFELTAYLFKGPPAAELYTMLGLDPATRAGV